MLSYLNLDFTSDDENYGINDLKRIIEEVCSTSKDLSLINEQIEIRFNKSSLEEDSNEKIQTIEELISYIQRDDSIMDSTNKKRKNRKKKNRKNKKNANLSDHTHGAVEANISKAYLEEDIFINEFYLSLKKSSFQAHLIEKIVPAFGSKNQ